jgi:soluble lytic murein transglycosylase-like protein
MIRLTALFLATVLLVPHTLGQTFSDYLKLRKQYGITQATGVAALETLIGKRILEVSGRVKGSITVGTDKSLLLERTDGQPMVVSCATLPDWLDGNEIPARLLLKANRPTETSDIHAELLGAAPEHKMRAYEAHQDRLLAAASKGSKVKRQAPKQAKQAKQWYLPASQVTPYYAAFIKTRNKRLPDSEALRIAQGVVGFSLKYGVDARLIMAMVMIESGFNPSSRSGSGAMGLGQLMPSTAAGMGVSNAYDSIENLNATVHLVRGHLEKYKKKTGDNFQALILALAAYNAGSGAVKRAGGVPPYRETQNYIRKVTALYYKFCGAN